MATDGLAGRVAVVSGASAGIGAAVARAFARLGAGVVINARRAELLHDLADEINTSCGREACVCLPGDAGQAKTAELMLDRALDHFKRQADLVVVNAGRGLAGSVLTSDIDQWEEMVRINLLGAAHLIRAAGVRMRDEADRNDWPNHARDLVVLGSTVGRHISPFSSMYGSTKFAVNSMAEAARRELGPSGVRVSLIEPGIVQSEFQGVAGYDAESFGALMDEFGPVLEPEDVARTIAFVVSQPAPVHLCDVLIRPTRQGYP